MCTLLETKPQYASTGIRFKQVIFEKFFTVSRARRARAARAKKIHQPSKDIFASPPDCGQNKTAVSEAQHLLSDFEHDQGRPILVNLHTVLVFSTSPGYFCTGTGTGTKKSDSIPWNSHHRYRYRYRYQYRCKSTQDISNFDLKICGSKRRPRNRAVVDECAFWHLCRRAI